jgi:hypothetical protein
MGKGRGRRRLNNQHISVDWDVGRVEKKTSRLINDNTGLRLYTVPISLATVLDSEQREKNVQINIGT